MHDVAAANGMAGAMLETGLDGRTIMALGSLACDAR